MEPDPTKIYCKVPSQAWGGSRKVPYASPTTVIRAESSASQIWSSHSFLGFEPASTTLKLVSFKPLGSRKSH